MPPQSFGFFDMKFKKQKDEIKVWKKNHNNIVSVMQGRINITEKIEKIKHIG